MKPATLCMWAFIAAGAFALVKANLLIREVPDFEHQKLSAWMQLLSAILFVGAAVCGLIRAIERRSTGQAIAKRKAVENVTQRAEPN